jgi:hypothetical protein
MTGDEASAVKCACCPNTYHPATGGLHYVPFTGRYVAFCGVCERDFVKWIKHMQARRWGGKRFYEYAFPPKEE